MHPVFCYVIPFRGMEQDFEATERDKPRMKTERNWTKKVVSSLEHSKCGQFVGMTHRNGPKLFAVACTGLHVLSSLVQNYQHSGQKVKFSFRTLEICIKRNGTENLTKRSGTNDETKRN